jgi:Photosynthetic reaction centre cytochrome C subunit
MKPTCTGEIVLVAVAGLSAWTGLAGRTQTPQAANAVQSTAKEPSNQEVNAVFVQRISKQIAGHEQEPSGQVFKNIQVDVLKKTPAARLLLIMNEGYSNALGVNCKHCHVEDDFSKDDKRPKRCARDMAGMHFSINQQLAKMQNLAPSPNGHYINCSTCHRGAIDPLENH